ncbi:sulfatase [Sphingobium phenoxybenzoativorans]|uniref:Sulfatase n=1 Tax=Sphingobium phenoxybenzoativorans TaxID=1592790 RepID=A0A975K6I7_9SPHN|nr:sulfatase [Sphingobium phenoxybenzoativorans]QUT05690.1 sulfatase [Sphingobium phenoxybenzoativorans]
MPHEAEAGFVMGFRSMTVLATIGRPLRKALEDREFQINIVRLAMQSAAALAILLACRALIIYNEWTEWSSIDVNYVYLAKTTVHSAKQDALVLTALTLAAFLLVRSLGRWAIAIHLIWLFPVVLVAAINVRVTALFGEPATAGLLRFAGLADPRALGTIIGYADPKDLLLIAGGVIVLSAVSVVAGIVIRHSRFGEMATVACSVIALAALAAISVLPAGVSGVDGRRHANAFARLAQSWFTPDPLSASETMAVRSVDPFSAMPSREKPITTLAAAQRAQTVRNVIVVVMESVGGHYLDLLGRPETAPNLAALLRSGAYFPNAYAHAPSSSMSLFAILSGMYPPVAYETMPDMAPDLPLPTIMSELGSRGFRTGTFFSAGWDYAGYTEFLRYQGVEKIETALNRRMCNPGESHKDPSLVHAADFASTSDECTASSMMHWIGKSSDPFVALLWTNRTHYPYHAGSDAESSSTIRDMRARYEDGIRATDRLIANMVSRLRERGFLDDTLIVVLGDHGEGFGQHGATVHGHHIYDEFIRVPLILINPRLFAGAVRQDVVGQIDVAPTILDAMGLRAPAAWHGLSLFGPIIRERTFFAVPWSSVFMGYRSGTMKVDYEVTSRKVEIFDLRIDPDERRSVSALYSPNQVKHAVDRLWSWKNIVGDRYSVMQAAHK